MESSSVYITLPSSACRDIYPENTLAHYRTELGTPITVNKDEYEIGLAEFQLNAHIFNIENDQHAITILRSSRDTDILTRTKSGGLPLLDYKSLKLNEYYTPGANSIVPVDHENLHAQDQSYKPVNISGKKFYSAFITIPRGYYSGLRSILDVLNKRLKSITLTRDLMFILKERIEGDSAISKVELISIYGLPLTSENKFRIITSQWFDYGVTRWYHSEYSYQLNFIFDFPRLIDSPSIFYIYCNIIEYQHVGGIRAQVLRTVHIENNNGTVSVVYENPHYVGLNTSYIHDVEVYIRDIEGNLVSFDRGSLALKLHLRRKRE